MNKMKNVCSRVLCMMLILTLCIVSIPMKQAEAATNEVNYTGSDAYEKGKYGKALDKVVLTGNYRQDIVAVALSQVGYREGDSSAGYSGETKPENPKNYTEYGRWNYETNGNGGKVNHAWCASFVAWCARRANIPTGVVNNSAGAKGITNSCAVTYTVKDVLNGAYTPQPGDLIYYSFSHVGIVVSYDKSTQKVTTVEGNTGTDEFNNDGYAVKKKTKSLTTSEISMFGSLEKPASSLKISMTSVPSSITKGESFNLAGTVSSNYNISSVKGYIMSNSTTVQSASCKPNSKSVNIKSSTINQNLKFGSLAAGSYTLKIVAKDDSGKSCTYTSTFTVKAPAASTLKISMTSTPTSIKKGSSFNLAGTVSSNNVIDSVKGYITSNSTTVQSASCKPNSMSVNIKSSAINQNLKFGSLPTGSYTLKIVATDTSGKKVTYTKSFKVVQ